MPVRRKLLTILIGILLITVSLISGCVTNEKNTNQNPNNNTTNNDENDNKTTNQTEEKNTSVPVYTGSTNIALMSNASIWADMNVSTSLNKSTYVSNDSVEDIYNFYDGWIKTNTQGWVIKREGVFTDPETINITSAYLKFQKNDEGLFIFIIKNESITSLDNSILGIIQGNWTLISLCNLPQADT